MTDVAPKTNHPDRMTAPPVGVDPLTGSVPKKPVVTGPQPKSMEPEPGCGCDAKEAVGVSTKPKP